MLQEWREINRENPHREPNPYGGLFCDHALQMQAVFPTGVLFFSQRVTYNRHIGGLYPHETKDIKSVTSRHTKLI